MAQRYKFSIESKSFPLYISGEPFYQGLTYEEVLRDGIHTILFPFVNHYGLVQFTNNLYLYIELTITRQNLKTIRL